MLLEVCHDLLQPGVSILDIGSGRTPAIPIDARPADCRYVGLDISRDELAKAPAGAYTETRVGDATLIQESLVGRFDLVITWQVLEHVQSTQRAIDCMHAYLKPGGMMVSMLSGKNTLFAIPNRIIPFKLSVFAMEKLLRRQPDTVFPAVYDLCSYDELSGALSTWKTRDIRRFWRGASYVRFSAVLERLYLFAENHLRRNDKRNFATHYLIVATR